MRKGIRSLETISKPFPEDFVIDLLLTLMVNEFLIIHSVFWWSYRPDYSDYCD